MSDIAVTRFEAATDPLRPFVPRIAVDWLRDAPTTRTRAYEGTLVFADISGFTDLTETLAKRGRRGAEEIAGVVDAAFGELMRRAYAQHADLLKYGGDAVLLLFRGDDHARRACSAAVGMQEALSGMRGRSTSAGPVRLRMSVGIHSGSFHCFLVGGVHRELIITGADATICVETEAIARAGEIALSAATASALDPVLLGELRDGVVLLARSPDAPETVPPFFDPSGVDLSELLPAAYTRELRGEPSDPEHRHVAIAFVELRDTDGLLAREGPDALAQALDEQITAIQESCLTFDVTFAQTDVSKGGVKAILLAGAPRSAGGEEEELMLRATRAIIERPGVLPLRIGVNTGRVFAGIVGTQTRRTYTFYGDAINTAARIMVRAADGQLLAREEVLARARTTYAATPIEPFAAKGKSELVRAADVGEAAGEREQEATGPFVGRGAERDMLVSALGRAVQGRGALVIVTGDPGMGKTRLLGELIARAADARTLRVQCTQSGVSHPYSAAGTLLRRALQVDVHAPPSLLERRLRDVVAGSDLEPWLPLLGVVVGLALDETPESAALEERFVPERIAASVESLLDRLVPEAALVAVDDAHCLDEASAALLSQIARGIHERRWLLVIAERSTAGGFDAPEGLDALRLPLVGLDASAALLLVQQLSEDAPLPAHVANAVANRSDGSPLFVTEMLAAMRAGAGHDALPESVEDLMTLQIDELSAADRGVLRQASVMGTRFTRAGLVAALELDDTRADAVLDRLGDLLIADGEGGLSFRHGLLRDAAYHGLSFSRRRSLHRRVGESLELDRDDDGNLSGLSGDLTHHFFEGGVWEKALRYGLVAGAEARAVYANVDAAAVLERALAAGARWRRARPETVMSAAEALGDVRLSLGELERAQAAFVLARRRVRGDAVERARLLRKEANVAYRLGEYPRAIRVLEGALELLDGVSSRPATWQRARIEALLGITLWRRRPREAVEWLNRAIGDAEAVDARKALAHALAGLDLAYNALGDPRRGTHSARALELYRDLGDLASQGGVLNNLGTMAYFEGRWNEALELYRQALSAWDQAGDTQSVSMASFNIGEILSAQGRLDEAEPLLREAERSSRAAGGASDIAESMMELALLHARRGDVERALEQLEGARRLVEQDGDPTETLLADARVAEALQLGGDYERAAELATRTLELAADDEGSSLIRPALNRVLGQAHALAGRPDAARAALELAIAEANRFEHRYEEALALAVLSRLGDEPPERAARREMLFEQLGIVALPAQAERNE
ncbi:MAG TPA: tetratricopeptide repeat protein [Gaiellales bacterium]